MVANLDQLEKKIAKEIRRKLCDMFLKYNNRNLSIINNVDDSFADSDRVSLSNTSHYVLETPVEEPKIKNFLVSNLDDNRMNTYCEEDQDIIVMPK